MRLEGIVSFDEAVHLAGLRYGTDLVVEVARGSIEVGQSIVLRDGIPLTVERVRDRGSDGRPFGSRLQLLCPELAPSVAAASQMGDVDGVVDDGRPPGPLLSPWAAVMRCVRDDVDARTLAWILAVHEEVRANGIAPDAFFEPYAGQRVVGSALSCRLYGTEDHYVSLGLEYGTTPADLARFIARCTAAGVEFDPLDPPR